MPATIAQNAPHGWGLWDQEAGAWFRFKDSVGTFVTPEVAEDFAFWAGERYKPRPIPGPEELAAERARRVAAERDMVDTRRSYFSFEKIIEVADGHIHAHLDLMGRGHTKFTCGWADGVTGIAEELAIMRKELLERAKVTDEQLDAWEAAVGTYEFEESVPSDAFDLVQAMLAKLREQRACLEEARAATRAASRFTDHRKHHDPRIELGRLVQERNNGLREIAMLRRELDRKGGIPVGPIGAGDWVRWIYSTDTPFRVARVDETHVHEDTDGAYPRIVPLNEVVFVMTNRERRQLVEAD